MVEVIVEYDYTAAEPDELTIKKGDIIKDVIKKQEGWWEGTLGDKKGVFPDNFVKLLNKDSSIILRNKKDVSRIRQCRVVFSYNQNHEDELNLNTGDIIDILGEEEEGWWRGTLGDKEGVFPSNFVEEIPWQPHPSTRVEHLNLPTEIDSKAPKLPAKPVKFSCEAKFPYKAQNDDELSFREGDIINLLNKDSQDPGWWQGELNGKIGVFPDNFVVLISSDVKHRTKEENKPSRIATETGAIKPSSVASQRKSLEVKNLKIEKSAPEVTLAPTKTTPPIPGKKPTAIKKSPSITGSGLFSEIKKKLVDVVDGAAGSKTIAPKTEPENNDENAFDQVERRPLLTDVRATRAKAPGRRPPKSVHKDDEAPPLSNGTEDDRLAADVADAAVATEPRVREWEKHKAPWLAEMKMNQAKRTSTSPGPELGLKLTPTADVTEDGVSSKSSPVEREIDMSKSMPPLDLSRAFGSKAKTPEEAEKLPLRTKPTPAVLTPITSRHTTTDTVKQLSPVTREPSAVRHGANVTLRQSKTAENDVAQLAEVMERLRRLEATVERQSQTIEELRSKLQVETDTRMLLQEKVMQNVQV